MLAAVGKELQRHKDTRTRSWANRERQRKIKKKKLVKIAQVHLFSMNTGHKLQNRHRLRMRVTYCRSGTACECELPTLKQALRITHHGGGTRRSAMQCALANFCPRTQTQQRVRNCHQSQTQQRELDHDLKLCKAIDCRLNSRGTHATARDEFDTV